MVLPYFQGPLNNLIQVITIVNKLVDAINAAAFGTVSSVSVTTANGFAGTVANPTTTPAITLSTTITADVLKGTGTAIIAAVPGVDYQPAGNYITALTGDVTATGPGSVAATLATVNADVGTFGTASQVGTFTVNAKGLITAASNTAILITASQVSDFNEAAQDAVGTILTNTATINLTYSDATPSIAADLNNTSVTPGTYKYTNLTVDAQGRLTAASTGIKTFTSTDQTITSAGALTLAHSLGVAPDVVEVYLVNQVAQLGYSIGDVLCANVAGAAAGNNKGLSIVSDATNLVIRIGSAAASFDIIRKDTGAGAAITNASWKLRFKAQAYL